jgi:hypothetical protein
LHLPLAQPLPAHLTSGILKPDADARHGGFKIAQEG